jgi:hypothetical protein
VPTKRGEQAPKDDDKRIVTVLWDALDPAFNPNYTMLLAESDFDKGPCFRAVWNGDQVIKKDGRSTVFGFTSNLPPTLEAIRIRGLAEVSKPRDNVKPVRGKLKQDKAGEGVNGAEGKGPTPKGEKVAEEPPAQPPANLAQPLPPPLVFPPPALGDTWTAAGGSRPFTGFGGNNGFGTGLGSAASGGGGSSGGGQTGVNQNAGTSTGTGTNGGSQTQSVQIGGPSIVFNPIQIELQAQGQLQGQFQHQKQRQRQQSDPATPGPDGHAGRGEVVPQPATLLLAAIGLPALLLLRRRKTQATTIPARAGSVSDGHQNRR